jgi:hypothetical protein
MRKLSVAFRSFADAPKRRHAVKRTTNRQTDTHTQNTHVSQVHEPQTAKRSARLTVHYKSSSIKIPGSKNRGRLTFQG